MRTITLALLFALILCGAANAYAPSFVWTEDFQGEALADYWQLYSDEYSFIDVVDDPTQIIDEVGDDPINRVLKIDTYDDGGMAYADVLTSAFESLDGETNEITASFRFYQYYEEEWDNYDFTILGSGVAGIASDGGYATDYGSDSEFVMPANEWINFRYVFQTGLDTHQVYMNDTDMGQFDNADIGHEDEVAFFVGDDEEDGNTWGVGLWDDFRVEGTMRQSVETPEPGSILALTSGLIALFARRRRK